MVLLAYTPKFRHSEAIAIARQLYGIETKVSQLPGERDQNFLLKEIGGNYYVMKIANGQERKEVLEAQNQAMQRIQVMAGISPQVLPSRDGKLIAETTGPTGRTHLVRLLTHLAGTPLADVKRHSDELLMDLGRQLGRLDKALAGFDHPAVHRSDFQWDLINGPSVINTHAPLIHDADIGGIVKRLTDDYQQLVVPLLPNLRQSVIHNDANDYNVIVDDSGDIASRRQRVAGFIDYGDLVYGYTVGNLAIAIAYVILNKPRPLASAARVVAGYHAENQLEASEVKALWGMICMRLCMSVSIAAFQQQQRPGDTYLSISQQPIYNTLPLLPEIHPRLAEAFFRQACGWEPAPRSQKIIQWLQKNPHQIGSVLDTHLQETPCLVLDLSVGSPLIQSDIESSNMPALTRRIFGAMERAGVSVGIGRYDEARIIYTSTLFAPATTPLAESRTIHLGMDLIVQPGTPIYAPLAGEVYLVAHNKAALDYGPLIILTHHTADGTPFYTLYGHLSEESLDNLHSGQQVAKGQRIGTVGSSEVNGGWMPHLHFQLIVDLLEMGHDFPGVAPASERNVWASLSPDPNSLLGVPAAAFPPKQPQKTETLSRRHRLIGASLSIGYHNPVKVLRGWKQYLFDETGRRYLDAYNNVPHVGHCHPRIVDAALAQMRLLNTNTRYLHDHILDYAEQLAASMPDPLSVCFFVNSASEGNELALRLARTYTGRRDIVVLEAAYHGHTTSLIDISPYKHAGPGGSGPPSWVHTAPIPDTYRGPFKADDPLAGVKYAKAVSDILEQLAPKGVGPAAFIAESYPSVGGQIIPPDGYLRETYRYVRQKGGLCIADEVQTGYGRIGSHFYAFEAQGVVPDIVVLGKPIGNGHPISAVITTPEIANAFDNGMEFFSTFGGNAVSCAVGRTVLQVVQEENLQQRALRTGQRMLEGLKSLKDKSLLVGDVRGSGLFLGIELVLDRVSLAPAPREAAYLVECMRDQGILMGTDGPYHNVVKIRPPMPFSEADADLLVSTMADILRNEF